MCSKVIDCPCECHKQNVGEGFHENIFSTPFLGKVKDEGKGPIRLDYGLMRDGKIPKTIIFRLKSFFRLL